MRFLQLWLLLLLTLTAAAEPTRLVLLHTNDLHGHITAREDRGLVRLATLVRCLRLAYPKRVVLLDAGDLALGTPTSGLFHGIPTARAMQAMGYDAVAIGNHEFNWGKEAMAEMLETIEAPALCANLVAEDGSRPYPGWTVIERGGVKLGVVGLVTPDTPRRAPAEATRGWRFLPADQALRRAMQELPEVDAVIALTHLGVQADQRLAEVEGLDLIIGGHSHTALHQVVEQNSVPIVQAGCYGQFLGKLEVEIEQGRLRVVDYRLLPVDEKVAGDPQVAAVIAPYAAQVRPRMQRVITTVTGRVSKSSGAGCYDAPLGNLIADAMRAETGADVALYNRGGMRFDMAEGPLSVGQVYAMFPFDDPVVLMKLSGAQLRRVLVQGTVGEQTRLSASGVAAMAVHRAGRLEEVRIADEPLREDRIYTVATTRFLAGGGDGMTSLGQARVEQELPFVRDLLVRYLEKRSVLEPPDSGRLLRQD